MKKLTFTIVFFLCLSIVFAQEKDEEISAIENNLMATIQIKGEPVYKYSIAERMEHYKVPGISIAVVKDGVIR